MEIFIVVALGALLLFMVFNTRKKQRQQQENLATNLVPGAQVMTTFGLFGTVLSIDEDENKVTIESGPGTVITLHKQAIGRIEPAAGAAPAVAVPDDASSLHEGEEEKTYGEQIDAREDDDADARRAGAARDNDSDVQGNESARDNDSGLRDNDSARDGDDLTAARENSGQDLPGESPVPGEEDLPKEGTLNRRDPESESSLESAEPQGSSSDDEPGDDRPTKA